MNQCDIGNMLAAIFAFRLRRCDISLTDITVFSQVCKSEGVTFKELAFLCGVSEPSVSRAVHTLRLPSGRGDQISHSGLVRVFQHPHDGRRRMVYLTTHGGDLRNEIERLLCDPNELAEAAGIRFSSAGSDTQRDGAAAD